MCCGGPCVYIMRRIGDESPVLCVVEWQHSEVFGAERSQDQLWLGLNGDYYPIGILTDEAGGIGSVSDIFYEFERFRMIKCSSRSESITQALLPLVGSIFLYETLLYVNYADI
ncbi:hypothetical protein Tco_1019133 [Tanacetum coccineum]|uniref:Uncharacterized protein n=1 Tax=Tanacetum coccineum TaxID=301880 RepID=A0ABQ5FXL2_9ASTR